MSSLSIAAYFPVARMKVVEQAVHREDVVAAHVSGWPPGIAEVDWLTGRIDG